MKFCKKCGKQLAPGQICDCDAGQTTQTSTRATSSVQGYTVPPSTASPAQTYTPAPRTASSTRTGAASSRVPPTTHVQPAQSRASAQRANMSDAGGFTKFIKTRIGVGDPDPYTADPYERGMLIVPDCVVPNDGEVPVRQYNIATLFSSFFSAEGRLQVTNKRIIFRATGRSFLGKITQHNEFAVDEIAGLEATRGSKFSFAKFLSGLIIALIGAFLAVYIVLLTVPVSVIGADAARPDRGIEDNMWARIEAMTGTGRQGVEMQEVFDVLTFSGSIVFMDAGSVVLILIFGFGGYAAFFLLKRKLLIKLLLMGVSFGSFDVMFARWSATAFFFVISLLIIVLGLFLWSMTPQMIITIKTKGAAPTVDIRSSGSGGILGRIPGQSDSVFAQVVPTEETESAIREMGALINDIQKLGDYGVNKWI